MPDYLSMVERGLKAVRFGIFQASDNLAMLLDGLCRAPEEQDDSYTYCGAQCPDWDTEVTCLKPRGHMFSHQCYETFWPLDSAASPQVAVVAPSPKQGSDSGPADSDILTSPAGPHPHQRDLPPPQHLLRDGARAIQFWLNGVPPSRYTRDEYELLTVYMRQLAEDLEARK